MISVMRQSTRWFLVSILALLPWGSCAEMNTTDMSSYARVVGGTQPNRARYPYFVRVDNNFRLHCGGVLIAPNVVLTAAHCIVGVNTGSLRAYTNAYNTFSTYDKMEVRSVVRSVHHPQYNSRTRNFDIGLLKLSTPVSYAATVPVNGDSGYPKTGNSMRVIGVGDRSAGGSSTTWLHEAEVRKIGYSTCNSNYDGDIVDSTMFCASAPGRDSCQGDSGGPILQTLNGVEQVVGIVSWGRGCAQNEFPGVYARTSAVKTWIDVALTSLTVGVVTKPVTSPLPLPLPATVPQQTSKPIRPVVGACDDDPQGTFNVGGVGFVQCRWLESNPDAVSNVCSIPSVYDMCAARCGKCNDGCNDDRAAKFAINGVPNLSCAFLRSNPSIANSVCKPGHMSYSACPETCNTCRDAPAPTPYPTPQPTLRPSSVPSLEPTIQRSSEPSKEPSVEPSTEPSTEPTRELPAVRDNTIPFRSNCDDSKMTFRVNDHMGDEHCVWLADRPSWQKLLCQPGHVAYSICEETCNVCRDLCYDSPRKFNVGDERHDCEWLSLRRDKQEQLCHPGHEAWNACPETCESCDPNLTPPPTSAPRDQLIEQSICDDSQRGRFWVDDVLKSQPCVWLKARPGWQQILCKEGGDIASMCPETCGVCQDNCEDESGKFMVDGEIHDCLWLSLRPDVQDKVCLEMPQNQNVRNICKETCNVCG